MMMMMVMILMMVLMVMVMVTLNNNGIKQYNLPSICSGNKTKHVFPPSSNFHKKDRWMAV